MTAKIRILYMVGLSLAIFAISAAAIASGRFAPVNPSNEDADKAIVANAVTISPPDAVSFTDLTGREVEAPFEHPVAVLNDQAAGDFDKVMAHFLDLYSPSAQPRPDEIAFVILAEIKYSSSQEDVLVTTTLPSTAASSQSLVLGDKEVTLANGRTAWTTEFDHGEYPNRILYIDGELIVTVASHLPMAEVERYAAEATMN
ncbi:MAG: hypothetical protein IT318_22695 [Anaerolineales bacterium]|nr:hypothetical protein [Anaerolineales bacterium]